MAANRIEDAAEHVHFLEHVGRREQLFLAGAGAGDVDRGFPWRPLYAIGCPCSTDGWPPDCRDLNPIRRRLRNPKSLINWLSHDHD
jgi:hypothetical protein